MAEPFDPRLEARLRDALRTEADAVPLRLRADEIERLAALRQRSRRSQRLAWLAMAAVVVVAVAGVAGFAALRPGPAGPDPLAKLPSFEELAALGGGGAELLRQQTEPITTDGQWQFGLPVGVGNLQIVAACSGGPLHISTSADGSPVDDLGTSTCDGQWMRIGVGANPRLSSAASASLELEAPAGTGWRLIVFAASSPPTPAGPPPPTPEPVPAASPTPSPVPTPLPTPLPTPTVTGTATVTDPTGRFSLTLAVDKTTFAPGETIGGKATLAFRGPGAFAISGGSSGPISFEVRELTGTRDAGGGGSDDCRPSKLDSAKPLVQRLRMLSGGWDANDPNAAWYQQLYDSPVLQLPAGTWEITVYANFVPDSRCGAAELFMAAHVVVVVGP